ncbi:MAG TPA: Asp-tRNA(Asn)/Glu-tRNA(Gln) amidotransferase subunit GatA [Gaiellales bacterium]|jgi:aspartyl-tRNA(Asn)/glutamyl-tRNA(Gln) amidotransferase subunit A
MAAFDVERASAEGIARLLDARELTCEEVAQAYLERIEALNGDLNVYLHVDPERVLARARALDSEGRAGIAGVPIAYKDLLCIRGVPTTAGSRVLEGYRPPYTATAVRRCEAEGLVELGKTNMDEFAMGSSTENSAYGPTRNPWDRERVPGGSSGGSAAAVAASMAPLSLGTDTGGSIRQPAALCGVVGLKPTYGNVSRYGAIAFASSLDQIGPFARTVRDCALALRVIAGADTCDSTCVGPPEPIELPDREDLRGIKVGAISLDGIEGVSPGVRESYEAALATVRSLGGELVEAKLEFSLTPHALAAYYLIAPAEASANLARYDGVRYGLRVDGDDIFAMYDATRERGFGREVKRRCLIGAYALSAGYYDAYYGQAQRVRTLIRRDFDTAFASCDLLLTPTAPTVAFTLGELVDDPLAMYACDLFTLPVNLSGLPALSLPCGLSDGLPVGLHLAGPAFSENRLLAAAHALEGAFAFDPRPPALTGAA